MRVFNATLVSLVGLLLAAPVGAQNIQLEDNTVAVKAVLFNIDGTEAASGGVASTVNIEIAGTAPATSTGAVDAQTLRVVLEDAQSGVLDNIATNTGDTSTGIQDLLSSLSAAAHLGDAVTLAPDLDPVACETADLDGAAIPNVTTETAYNRVKCTLSGVSLSTLTNEDATALPPIVIEDAAETAGGGLMAVGTVRRDVAASSAGATGDNATLNTDSTGRLWISGAVLEDVAESDGMQMLAVAAVRRDTMGVSGGASGDLSTFQVDGNGLLWTRFNDPCSGVTKTVLPVNVSTATTTELTASLAGASNNYYICSLNLVAAGADNVALTDDDTDNCASVTSGLAGGTTAGSGWNFAANGGMTIGNGMGTVFKTNGTNRVVCLVTSAAVQLSGSITVAAAP